jgi:hypothetical protein
MAKPNPVPPLKKRIATRIARSRCRVFTPGDFADIGGYDQVLRALRQLVASRMLTKVGYGLYARLKDSALVPGAKVLDGDFGTTVRESLTKLKVPFRESDALSRYNEHLTTQIQANCVLTVLKRFKRRIAYQGMEARFDAP